MAEKQKSKDDWLRAAAIRVSRVHFVYAGAYMASIVAFDSWNLISHEGIVLRWKAAAMLLVATTIVWYLVRTRGRATQFYRSLVLLLIAADVLFASYNVYWQRGMASKSVALFAIPIITAATLRSRRTVIATASMSLAAYSFAAVRYFHLNYGEGFKVELYGEIGFYAAIFFVLVGLLLVIIKPRNEP